MPRLLLLSASAFALVTAAPALAQDAHAGHTPPPADQRTSTAPATEDMTGMDHSGHDMAGMEGMEGTENDGHDMSSMSGVLGSYPMTREASGTSWQPDVSSHAGVHGQSGDWMLMGHVVLNGVYDWQESPRGDEKGFVSGMIMGAARRDFSNMDTLNLRVMLSPDAFMGKRGYPLLLAAGETADGVTPLVDRQHPHDLFMELSASYTHRLSDADSVFVYAGLPGEPAFGPPAFMHRLSIADSPEAPISHHWFDSTHITYGVVTAGWVHGDWKLEASSFKGREPDEKRYDIESPKLDSWSVRASWNPTANWSLQTSWADFKSPEQLHPHEDATRFSSSAIYTVPFGDDGWWSTTAAYGRKTPDGEKGLDAWALESAIKPNKAWTVFARAERIDSDELAATVQTVSKASIGAVRDWRVAEHVTLGLGALYAVNFTPSPLDAAYGSDPSGAMAFFRLKLD